MSQTPIGGLFKILGSFKAGLPFFYLGAVMVAAVCGVSAVVYASAAYADWHNVGPSVLAKAGIIVSILALAVTSYCSAWFALRMKRTWPGLRLLTESRLDID